jgi:hypothetical protein
MISLLGFTIFWIIHGNGSIDIGAPNWLQIFMVKYSKLGWVEKCPTIGGKPLQRG